MGIKKLDVKNQEFCSDSVRGDIKELQHRKEMCAFKPSQTCPHRDSTNLQKLPSDGPELGTELTHLG